MGKVEEVSTEGMGGTQIGGNVLQGGDTGGVPIWLRDLGTICGDGEDSGGDTHRFSELNHREAGRVEGRLDVGEYQGGRSLGSSSNLVDNELHQKNTGDGDTVGGAVADFRGMRKDTGYEGGRRRRYTWCKKRWRRHILGKPWMKYFRKLGGGNGERGTLSRGQGEIEGSGEQGFGYSGMETDKV